jgi:hypothetical protein
MKKNRTTTIFALLIIIIAICSVIYVSISNSFEDQINRYPKNFLSDFDSYDTGRYKIDPETILASLDRGETGVFALELATPVAPVFDTTISWHQSDYLKITNAVYQLVWKETFDSWSLLGMVFETTCRDNPNGFESGDIHFFKAVKVNGETQYTTREVLITPLNGDLSWGGGANFPHPIFGWKSIDLSRLKITAEDALRIAEDNGGKSFCLSKQNGCSLSLILEPLAYDGWSVEYEYVGNNGLSFFNIHIDPYTGKVIIR